MGCEWQWKCAWGFLCCAVMAGILGFAGPGAAGGQLPMPGGQEPLPSPLPNPLTDPTAKPGKVLLFDLEARFARDVRNVGAPVLRTGSRMMAWH